MTWISVPAVSVTRAILQKSLIFLSPILSFLFGFVLVCFVRGWGSEQQGEKGREHLKQCPHPARRPTPGFIPQP